MYEKLGVLAIWQRCYSEHDWHGKNQVNAIGAVCENRLFAVGLFNHSIRHLAYVPFLLKHIIVSA